MTGSTAFGHRHDDELHVTVISPWPGSPGNRKRARQEAEKMAEPGEWVELVEEHGNEYRFRASDAAYRLVIVVDDIPKDKVTEAEALVCECVSREEADALYTQTQAVLGFMAHRGKLVDAHGKYQMYVEARVGNGEWVKV